MIFLFLILGVLNNCQSFQWNLNTGHSDGHGFSDIGLDYNSPSHSNGLSFGEIALNHNLLYHWNHNGDLQGWNQISGSLEQKNPAKGLEAWLEDVVVGKDKNGLFKPIIKEIGYPVRKDVEIKIPYPQVQEMAQPYPVLIPMLRPVPFEVIKTVVKTVEKKVPTPVEKIVPVPVEKRVPFEVVKHVPVFVEKKIPIKIPIYKTIHHKVH